MDKRLKKCSTSTDVEPVHNPSQKVSKRELDNLEIKEKRKKQKKHNDNERSEEMQKKRMEKSEEEIEKLRKSLKEMTETVQGLQEIIQTKAITAFSLLPREENECNFDNKDHLGNNDWTLFVKGFDKYLPRLAIKNALWKHFSSCGRVLRVYVPIECDTGVALGFAFIDLKYETRGLKLNGSVLGGRKLSVMMAVDSDEYYGFDDFEGCERCCGYTPYSKGVFRNLWVRPYKWTPPIVVGSPFSKIGRFTGVICRLRSRFRS